MKRRPRRSTAATLTALIVLAACVVVTVVAVQLIIGERPWISYSAVAGALHRTQWTNWWTAFGAVVAVVLGLCLLLAAILPGRRTVLPLAGEPDSGASRASYRSTLRAAAAGVDGVSAAKVRLGRKRVRVRVRTQRTRSDGLPEAVRTAVTHRLDEVGPAAQPAVRVAVSATRST
ncbi:DUF6286 domain-containing protein [Amycolatopsis jiangsuensis]|uniref:DUF6286 domain-containing protein n=1 Tax=Amycolatopsis jiangsuensis TaxID=1181879 RepID=A0A840IRV0_9PSEU|nr:DUF6286 domain-containing protein [Amycolatopsis jiangsuensis]MBB4684165.1 hypothetical protein [Amycolatopsis jiangsuensis]